ncbi:MAG: trigger factor [Eubacteriales bacterium]|nr:trigger factor [Eubacteriales bacterium]
MASQLEKKDNHQVLLTIDVAPEQFADALQQAFRKNAKKFNVPGFRRGKAPMNIVTKYYGEGVLYEDAIDIAATPAYAEAVSEHQLEPVDRPEMDILDISRENGLKFTVQVTVKPEVTLGQYRGVEAVRQPVEVSDERLADELKRVQERNSRMVPVTDRPIESGDTANIDYKGFLNDEPFEGGEGSSYDLRIGSNSFIPGFEDQLIGHSEGDSCDLNVTFPDDYHSEDLKGKDVVFKVTVNSVKKRELPDLDDEFAKDVSEFNTLDEYKEDLRRQVQERLQSQSDESFKDNVIAAVTQNAAVDIPHAMIHQEMDSMVEQQRTQMQYQGIELEQYLSYMGQTMDDFYSQLHEPAENRVKSQLVLEAIAKEEKIEADDAEIEAEIERVAVMYNMKAEDLKERMGGSENTFIRDSVVSRKTIDFLAAEAVAIDPPAEPEPEAAEAGLVDVIEAEAEVLEAADVTEPAAGEADAE